MIYLYKFDYLWVIMKELEYIIIVYKLLNCENLCNTPCSQIDTNIFYAEEMSGGPTIDWSIRKIKTLKIEILCCVWNWFSWQQIIGLQEQKKNDVITTIYSDHTLCYISRSTTVIKFHRQQKDHYIKTI